MRIQPATARSFHRVKLGIAVAAAGAFLGCAGAPIRYFPEHTVQLEEEGLPVRPDDGPTTKPLEKIQPGAVELNEEVQEVPASLQGGPIEEPAVYQAHLQKISDGIDQWVQQGNTKVLVFVHGGMNTTKSTLQRVERLMTQCCEGCGCLHETTFPIFINWQSALYTSVRDHLFLIRQGRRARAKAVATAPFVLAQDLVDGVASLPTSIWENLADRFSHPTRAEVEKDAVAYADGGGHIVLGRDLRHGSQKIKSVTKLFPFGVLKPVTTPVVEGLGTEAWDLMFRRADLLFNGEDQRSRRYGSESALLAFWDVLASRKQAHPQLEITLVGHSMGTIVLNKALRARPEVEVKNIVYLAAACSIEDYQDAVWPYLHRFKGTHMYHLMLDRTAEVVESHAWDAIPRGSLLVWIDNLLEDARYLLDRTAGRASNLVPELGRTPDWARPRIHVKAFDIGNQFRLPATPKGKLIDYNALLGCQPQAHTEFGLLPFWREELWDPGQPRGSCRD